MTVKQSSNTIQAFWVALGSLSSFALAIISAAILSRYFDKAEYGTYKQVIYIYGTLLVVFSAGLPRVFSYFLPRYSIEEGKSIVSQINKVLFLTGLVFSLFIFLFSGTIARILRNDDLGYILKIFSPIPLLLMPTLGLEGIFSTYKKTIFIAIYNVLTRLLMLIFIVGPVVIYGGDISSAIYGWLIVSVISFFVALYFKGIPFKNVTAVPTDLTLKEIFQYSLPLVSASIWGIAIKAADQFYISRYFGAQVFAEYSNGFIELPFVAMVTTSTSVVLMPVFSKVFSNNSGIDELLNTWRNALFKSAIVIYPLVVFCIVYANELMILIYSNRYKDSGMYFQVNMFLNFFNIIIFAPLFLSLGKTKTYSIVHMILAILIWSTDYLIMRIFNTPYAIAISTTALNISKIFYFVYLSSRFLKIGFLEFFPFKQLAKLLFHSILVVYLVTLFQQYFFPKVGVITSLLICGSTYSFLLLASSRLFRIDYLSIVRPLVGRILK